MRSKSATRWGVQELRTLPTFTGCSDKELTLIDSAAAHVDVPAGRVLMREGQVGRESFVVLEGSARVTIDGAPVATAGQGDFIGEMALLDHKPRSATVTAETPMRLLVFDSRSFSSALQSTTFARIMLQGLSRRLRTVETTSA
jgi:CRP-like cAMP-binding protein